MRRIAIVGFVFLLGCATQTISSSDAKARANLTLNDYLNERFGERSAGQGLLASMTTGMENLRAKGASAQEQKEIEEKQARRVQKRADGSFLYTALYDGKQQVQLLRPMTELREFCKAKGGTFAVSKTPDPEQIDHLFQKRSNVAIMAGAQADAQANAFTGQESHALAMAGAMESAHLDRLEDRAGAAGGFRLAARKGAFGEATCSHSSRADARWKVDVLPIYFEPYNPSSSVKLHEIDVRIAPQR